MIATSVTETCIAPRVPRRARSCTDRVWRSLTEPRGDEQMNLYLPDAPAPRTRASERKSPRRAEGFMGLCAVCFVVLCFATTRHFAAGASA